MYALISNYGNFATTTTWHADMHASGRYSHLKKNVFSETGGKFERGTVAD